MVFAEQKCGEAKQGNRRFCDCCIRAVYGGFFLHARIGLETEYLSEKWFDLIRVCVEEARKLLRSGSFSAKGEAAALLEKCFNENMQIARKSSADL